MKTFRQMILPFALGFFGALAGTLVFGLVSLGLATLAVPDLESRWTDAGYIEKALWVGIPTVFAYTAVVMGLWRKHRMIAIGAIAFLTLDIVASFF